MAPAESPSLVQLRSAGVSLVVDITGPRLPRLLHWGSDLGPLCPDGLAALAAHGAFPASPGDPDDPRRPGNWNIPPAVGLLAEHGAGWQGFPGLLGHRPGGADWSPLLAVETVAVTAPAGDVDAVGLAPRPGAARAIRVQAADPVAALALTVELELTDAGLLRTRATVRNDHPELPYTLDGLGLTLPVPTQADELFDLTGRWTRERSPQRQPFHQGTWTRETRRGRPGHDAPLLLAAGTAGFGFRHGEIWALHLAWSGNHRLWAERLPTGQAVLGAGELPMPGEISLAPGAHYTAPWLYAGHSDAGLDGLTARFHDQLRARPHHPRKPRPVVLNTWEAVYFDHDLDRLRRLADLGAEIGVERYVLDDGWFRGRRDDSAGLGDWYVDETVWPDGLHPLVDHVRGLGLEFGLWVEPEMVNPDSDLARAHPEWIMATGGRLPGELRGQQVLDLTHPGAYAHVRERLDALLSEYPIDYLKWDHNRELADAGHQPGGEAAVHGQTLAVYRLMDQLRADHPGLEIESCSGGGARVDLGILEHADRIWGSDCNDALERQSINRWTMALVPPELVGSHVGAARSHTTGRTHDLAFRAGTALFGHLGIEWDLTRASAAERRELARWIAHHKRLRGLLHGGRVVRVDHPDPALWMHGVVAPDRAEAVFALVAVGTSATWPHGRVRLPGLDPAAGYRLAVLPPGPETPGLGRGRPAWCVEEGVTGLRGSVLERAGLQLPTLHPEQLVLLHLTKE
ncbi:alpha-galactosidase [Streptomyces sp. 3MP-14]|uniref:Alpha-galactosidase n=1 Tax=Streptomyces mimosae TaxID=2586635 RepID=A0A5N6AS32_9ACTN|nr:MULTISPECIES: alpha-galactosidase [Streptomyces]KAB8170906.1 alpha-galactosidase [Streptomyces mimosae]KAB8179743.1 alpha-galactosidase [Streptomyces sp. 3MP-14]